MVLSNKSAFIRIIIFIALMVISCITIYFSGMNPDNIPMVVLLVSLVEFIICFLCPDFKKKAK